MDNFGELVLFEYLSKTKENVILSSGYKFYNS
ncbi:hypothetical protein VT91_12540 [Clostridium sporogenes]|nr:hypothetical protein T257_2598 [Clostridium botulinum CDC_297]AJE10035.1 hypothetical protein T259_1279 [Clostridium botulinum CDC_1436]APH19716.1 hypothetical protein NPD3_1463 [Clostridium botulinum]KRU26539.1 hypothetical protein WG71_25040 [Clostridium sporogenes]APU61783.1 hypothetical protein NPD8_3742 [Clostridium botulinum]